MITEIINYKSAIEANVDKKKITISIKGKANIAELNYNCDLEKDETIKKLQTDLNDEVENLIKTSIKNTTKEYNTDIYGFRDLFYKKDPQKYNDLKDSWYDETYQNLEIEVKANIELFEKGNLNGGIYHESK